MKLDAALICQSLREKVDISIFESIPSTHDYLKSFRQCRSVKFCLAEQQTQGRGRLGREWHSPFGKNIYFSCLYPFDKDISELGGLSLVVSLAILRSLQAMGLHESLCVKWPNDIMYEGKKLSGTLIDAQAESHGMSQAVIGIGINVNMIHDDARSITQAWTSMATILRASVDRNRVAAVLIHHLLDYLARFNRDGFAAFIAEWREADCLINKTITLQQIHDKVTGQVMGVNEQGHLLLKLTDGKVHAFSSGDTSVQK